MQTMVLSTTERVRLSRDEQRHLQQVAKRTGRTKSDVLRAGLAEQWAKLELLERRREGFAELIRMAERYPAEPKLRFRAK